MPCKSTLEGKSLSRSRMGHAVFPQGTDGAKHSGENFDGTTLGGCICTALQENGNGPVSSFAHKMEGEGVKFETRGHIAIFTMDRPKARNAINGVMSAKFEKFMDEFERDDNLWVGIITSSHESVFCAGADLKAINKGEQITSKKGGFAGVIGYPRTKPLIAAVDGKALAGGCEIVLSCDMVVASKKAVFGVPEVKRSLVPAAGGLFRLPRKIPRAIAYELCLTGDPIDVHKAQQYGLVNDVTEIGKALEGALKLAQRIEVNAPLAVREAKACIDEIDPSTSDEKATS